MDYKVHVESGCQLLARLAPRPSLHGLDDHILTLNPNETTIIEVKGQPGSGKSMLLLTWAAKTVLPKLHGGLGAGVVLIDTDMHFSIFMFRNMLEALLLQHQERLSANAKEAAIKSALEQLTVISICDGFQLRATLFTLDKLLLNAPRISLILLDSLSAYYWSDRLSGGERLKDKYQQKVLSAIYQKIHQHKITLGFTKNSDFQSQSGQPSQQSAGRIHSGVNIHIELKQIDEKFEAVVTTSTTHRSFSYIINYAGVIWT